MIRVVLAVLCSFAAVSASAATARIRIHNAAAQYVYVSLVGGGLDLDGYFGAGETKYFTREISSGDVGGQVNSAGLAMNAQLQSGLAAVGGTETAFECYVEPDGTLNFVPLASVDVTGWPSSPWDYAAAAYAFASGFFLFLGFGVWRSIRRTFNDAS